MQIVHLLYVPFVYGLCPQMQPKIIFHEDVETFGEALLQEAFEDEHVLIRVLTPAHQEGGDIKKISKERREMK